MAMFKLHDLRQEYLEYMVDIMHKEGHHYFYHAANIAHEFHLGCFYFTVGPVNSRMDAQTKRWRVQYEVDSRTWNYRPDAIRHFSQTSAADFEADKYYGAWGTGDDIVSGGYYKVKVLHMADSGVHSRSRPYSHTSSGRSPQLVEAESNGGEKPSFARLEDDSDAADAFVDGDAPASNQHAPESKVPVEAPELVALTDAEAVIKKCKDLLNTAKNEDSKAQSNITVGKLCLTASSPASDSASLALKLYTPVRFINNARTKFPLGSLSEAARSFDQSVVYQQIIEQEHLKLQSENYTDAEMNYEVSTGAMSGWVFKGNEDFYEEPLAKAIALVFFIFVFIEIARIKEENENGTSEHQCVMGLSDAELFWGNFLTAVVKGLLASIVAITVMFLPLKHEHPYGEGLNVSLVTASFAISLIGECLLAICILWVFPKGSLPLVAPVVLLGFAPFVITRSTLPLPLHIYFLESRKSKLATCVLPHIALYTVMKIICIARDYEGGASWSLVTRRVLGKDNVTIGELWGGMLLCDVVMTFLALYLSKVLPWSTNNRQSPIFCLLPNYWRDEPAVAAAEKVNVKQDVNRFEKLQPGDKVIITTDNLTKVFGAKPVLNGLNLKVCASKITVLLGHNGSGKTTLMTILTGMQAPTSGAATVCGYNVASQRHQVRQRVSFCQQTDIFFEYMTCAENVYYFGSLKGGKPERLEESVRETLRLVELEDKASSLPKTLSGGMRRKLSIAMTLLSKPELLILDEPTAGMDAETRRTIWNALTNLAKDRTLLLSSHDMEEADAIADQIIIMASGGIVCSGSISFLKKACGVGYKLTFSKVKNAFKLHDAMHIVHKTIPAAVVDDEKQEEVSIALGTLDSKDFPAMFKALESSLEKLGIAGIGVTAASMKDVYLKINLDWAPGGKAREQAVGGKDIDVVCKPITKRRTWARSFFALSVKRLLSLLRSWDVFLFFFVAPLALLVILAWNSGVGAMDKTLDRSRNKTLEIPVELGAHFPRSRVVVGESPATDVSRNLRTLVEAQDCTVLATKDAEKELRKYTNEDFRSAFTVYPLAVAFESNDIRMVPNPTSAITLPITVNLVYTAWLRALTAQPAAQINVTIAYIEGSEKPDAVDVILLHISSWTEWVFGASMTYTYAFTEYCIFPLTERLSGARDVQLMTGLSGVDYVFAHFVFDFIYHLLFSLSWCIIYCGFGSYSLSTTGLFLLGFAASGPLFICVGYLAAEFTATTMSAALWFIFVFSTGPVISLMLKPVMYHIMSAVPHYVALIMPPYAVHSMFFKIWHNAEEIKQCKLLEKDRATELGRCFGCAAAVESRVSLLDVIPAYDNITSGYSLGIDCTGGLLQFTYNGIGFELVAVVAEGLLLMALMIFLMSGCFLSGHALASDELPGEQDVEEEKKRVKAARQQDGLAGYSLLAWSLHKWFGTLHAVRGIYMALRPTECFGLLGVNGAGKTTTFQMLAGLISVSDGDAATAVAKLSTNIRQWQSQISYCFQLGGLLDNMNAYEYLYLVGRLRGIPENELEPMVDSILSVVDLTEHASKECGVYSGGNRRKLTIAAALLGVQPFVFLDEPYAGVDVVSQNKILRAVAEMKKRSQTTFILTSHNMEECELSCDRLTIMVNGQMMCLGTLQHLREKFGQGYRVEFFLEPTVAVDEVKLKKAVNKLFPGIQLKDVQKNLLSYHLMERIPWSELFTKVAHLQKKFPLEHALVGENTLQDIFLNFAKAQGSLLVPGFAAVVDVGTPSSTKSPAALSSPTAAAT
ncbi:phospholipid-transporting ATPase ABCA3-like isoform X4 [Dermacentor albipictus]|uniref:phospholipid-transporting ATPase ABCA3-like isoform X4 n=1 Tax=Dermacentor albipictus TaxID=60249 RepID=UPI0038FC6EC8